MECHNLECHRVPDIHDSAMNEYESKCGTEVDRMELTERWCAKGPCALAAVKKKRAVN